MRAKILILSSLIIAVLVSSGCFQQKCPESCDDGDDCTKDYCSSITNYLCKNDPITPCCGNGICENGECGKCSKDCSEEQCVPFTVKPYYSFYNSRIVVPLDKMPSGTYNAIFNLSEDGAYNHIYFKVEAGNENVKNLDVYASCGGYVLQKDEQGQTDIKTLNTGKIKAPFYRKVSYYQDKYGKNAGEVYVFNIDYFINNEGVLLDENRSTAILMNPHGTVNYRIWFYPASIVPRIGEGLNSTYQPGEYTLECSFDFVSSEPEYVVNKIIDINFIVNE